MIMTVATEKMGERNILKEELDDKGMFLRRDQVRRKNQTCF